MSKLLIRDYYSYPILNGSIFTSSTGFRNLTFITENNFSKKQINFLPLELYHETRISLKY